MKTATNYRVFNYELSASNGGTLIYNTQERETPFSNEIKLTPNIGRAKTKTKYWLSEILENGFYGQPTTGLFEIGQIRWNYGDIDDKKHFCIFEYRQDKKVLRIFYFKDFYPRNPKRFTIDFIKG